MVDGGVLLLPQHHQGDDNHRRYDNTSDHKADDGALVGADVLGEEHLKGVKGQTAVKLNEPSRLHAEFVTFPKIKEKFELKMSAEELI